jgi:hypothetical protein
LLSGETISRSMVPWERSRRGEQKDEKEGEQADEEWRQRVGLRVLRPAVEIADTQRGGAARRCGSRIAAGAALLWKAGDELRDESFELLCRAGVRSLQAQRDRLSRADLRRKHQHAVGAVLECGVHVVARQRADGEAALPGELRLDLAHQRVADRAVRRHDAERQAARAAIEHEVQNRHDQQRHDKH